MESDEGPWPKRYAGEEIATFGADITNADWPNMPAADLREKMAILSAIRMPGHGQLGFGDRFAPVNTFRTVLRELFGVPLPNLRRRALVFESDDALYKFTDVLPKLQSNVAH